MKEDEVKEVLKSDFDDFERKIVLKSLNCLSLPFLIACPLILVLMVLQSDLLTDVEEQCWSLAILAIYLVTLVAWNLKNYYPTLIPFIPPFIILIAFLIGTLYWMSIPEFNIPINQILVMNLAYIITIQYPTSWFINFITYTVGTLYWTALAYYWFPTTVP